MLAAWRAVCLAALTAALAAEHATGKDANAGETVRDFGLVCEVYRNVLTAAGVAKREKARAAEVELAVEHAWLGKDKEALNDKVGARQNAETKKKKAKAELLKTRAWDVAQKIEELTYVAILGNITGGRTSKTAAADVLFEEIAGNGGDNGGFGGAGAGSALANDMMWLCNLAGANGRDKTKPFKEKGDDSCPCTPDGAAAQYLQSVDFWSPMKKQGTTKSGGEIARNWQMAKQICLKGQNETTVTKEQTRKPVTVARRLSTAVTRVMAAIDTDGKAKPTGRFCLGQRAEDQTCDGDEHGATACVCYDHHRGHITWSDAVDEMETQLEQLQDVMTELDQLHTEAEGLNRTRDQEATSASQTQEASRTRDAGQSEGNGTNTQNNTPEERGNRKKRTAEQDETNDAQKEEDAGQGNEECGPAHPPWNTDTKTCSTTRRSAHVTAILTLLATALDAQDTRMAQQILQ
ncbi:hypothetical protein ERJ75_001120100 [Trypanosoma vivax]|nr:hypothetical protein ERJ75_001120100 [Trypanosoma vivax]